MVNLSFIFLGASTLLFACMSRRLFYLHSELPKLEKDNLYAMAPGPWDNPNVPIITSDAAMIPDSLVISTLKALMRLPGAMVKCDLNVNQPPHYATEYCLALYKTPKDWRASWPVRSLLEESSLCEPPYGGVEDKDFGREVALIGFAHNHPCGKHMSSPDLGTFPVHIKNVGTAVWELLIYAETPAGILARSSQGAPIPTAAWLATYQLDEPLFYRWDFSGNVFVWSEARQEWEFRSKCTPQSSAFNPDKALKPSCNPPLE